MSSKGFVGFIAGALVLVVLGGVGTVAAQSLADVAKREEERRKTLPASGKTYTNSDLTPTPAPSQPAAAPAAGAADAKADKADKAPGGKDAKDEKDKDAKAEPAKDQKYWADRRKAIVEQIDRDSTYAEALQSRINALTTDFVNRDDPAQRAQIEQNRTKALAELERLRKQIADGKKALTDFEEAARKAGVPPGWLR